MSTRLRLRRADGVVYQERWGLECRWAGVYIHRFSGPDPGEDLHDHPWAFASLVLRGGYEELRASARDAPLYARLADAFPGGARRGHDRRWRAGSVHLLRLDECHRITGLLRSPTWTLVLRGPRRRSWGFYTGDGFLDWRTYEATRRRPLSCDLSNSRQTPGR